MRVHSIVVGLFLGLWTGVVHAAEPARPGDAVASWIWASRDAVNDQVLIFRRTFELPADLAGLSVNFWGSCDNVLSVSINGQPLGFSTEWTLPMSHDITKLVRPGKNVIAIR